MKKLSFDEFVEALMNQKEKYGIIVFKQHPDWDKEFTETERSYITCSAWGKYFKSGLIGNSLIGNCLDNKDKGVRLDWYIHDENGWQVDYCYLITKKEAEEYV